MLQSLALALTVALPQSPAPSADSVPLFDNLGRHHRAISTRVPATQRYFDQGLRLAYGFNHAEAIRAFAEGARRDPDCAICQWGVALAYGPNINAPMDSASGVLAYQAIQRAQALASGASPVEQDLIRALATRYAPVPRTDRAALDSAYASAMRGVAAKYPEDLDVTTLYVESMMDLRPWTYWTMEGEPQPGTADFVARLEQVIATDPNHPGACHYYIHAVEAAAPEKAVPCAERLASLMPGAGHIVHMPAHIYIRVGRYADAIRANEHAVHTDERYIASERPQSLYAAAYYPHNLHFLAFASTLAGRSGQAIAAARGAAAKTPLAVARIAPSVQPLLAYPHLTLASFGRWNEVLSEPLPPADVPYASALAWYARGVARAAKKQRRAAQAALDSVRAMSVLAPADAKPVLDVAAHALMGEIAARSGKRRDAIAHFRQAMALEDQMMYIEPPLWHYPIRHSLGALLLASGQAREAEQVYREDLARFPENGWALHGLARALRARGANAAARAVEARLRTAWAGADVKLVASRF